MRLAPALLFLLAAGALRLTAAPPGTPAPPEYLQLGTPDQAKGRAVLLQLRDTGMASGSYYLEFELRQMPRRGDEHIFHGRIWGGRTGAGPIMRIVLANGTGPERRFLIQNGPHPAAWSNLGGRVAPLGAAALMSPLVDGVEVTVFDLQMPFLFWPDATLTGLERIHGRPADVFVFHPPADFAAAHPEVAAVRAYLDTDYNAPVQTEIIGGDGRVLKTLSLVDLKKVSGQWMVNTADVRNETTRDKTRFSLTGAALGLDLPPSVFSPDLLAGDAPVPPRMILISP